MSIDEQNGVKATAALQGCVAETACSDAASSQNMSASVRPESTSVLAFQKKIIALSLSNVVVYSHGLAQEYEQHCTVLYGHNRLATAFWHNSQPCTPSGFLFYSTVNFFVEKGHIAVLCLYQSVLLTVILTPLDL